MNTSPDGAHWTICAFRRARGVYKPHVILGFVCAAVIGVFYAVFVLTTAGQTAAGMPSAGAVVHGQLHFATERITSYLLPVASGITVVVCALLAWRKRGFIAGCAALAIFVGAVLSTELLKRVLPEPEIVTAIRFPSGHSTAAMATACIVILTAGPAWRRVVAVYGIAFATLIGTGVVTVHWHRVDEVVAGFCMAVLWAVVVTAILARRDAESLRGFVNKTGPPMPAARTAGWVFLGCVYAYTLACALVGLTNAAQQGLTGDGVAYLIGLGAIAVIAWALVAAFRSFVDSELRERVSKAQNP